MKKVEYKKGSHSKYLLRYHFVMCTKYRHKILTGDIETEIKKILEYISKVEGYEIDIMETDIDHIHLLIEAKPMFSPFGIVHKIKTISTNRIWKKYGEILKKYYWKENTFWSDGYFVCSIVVLEKRIVKQSENILRSKVEKYLKKLLDFKTDMSIIVSKRRNTMAYLYDNGCKVWHYDSENNRIVQLTIRHTMSGWNGDDWEYYNCIGSNYDEDGDDIWEVSQHTIFSTKKDANDYAINILQRKVNSSEENAISLRKMLDERKT